jgi:hypothetical protein
MRAYLVKMPAPSLDEDLSLAFSQWPFWVT